MLMGIGFADAKQTLWNSMVAGGNLGLGFAVAALVNKVGNHFFNPNSNREIAHYIQGAAHFAGLGVSYYLLSPPHVTLHGNFARDKMMVLFGLQTIIALASWKLHASKLSTALIASAGLGGYFGSRVLMVYSAIGAIFGSMFRLPQSPSSQRRIS